MLRRALTIGLILGLVSLTYPAQARYGAATPVDTWVRIGDRIQGRHNDVGPLRVWAPSGSVSHVVWFIQNMGSHNIPALHHVTFHGCDDAKGFHFRYIAPSGEDVTGPVTHAGYAVHRVHKDEYARVHVWIRSSEPDRSYSCVLHATGNGLNDDVKVRVHS
jgi:hypothetical protein